MAYQSLYRRYRPSRFSELRGQDHVVVALHNAVRNDSVTHAYLFSGPRGTGKTSTARILAKALNCENPQDGEPCGECQSCQDMDAGRSFDLFELDAASNNGVDAIRDLVDRAAVGSPGRTKVYILDEVHMLSTAASNALLKTLEEPPGHVRFVLATTDPQKVLPTIRSRTQHFEFQLLSAAELEDYVRWIAQDAQLDIDDEAVRWAVRQGKGSARDTLSALDQVVAAGGVVERAEPVDQLLEALAEGDPGGAVRAVADALNLGHDPRVLGRALLDSLRDLFLLSLDAPVPHLVADDLQRMSSWAKRLGTPLLTRSIEAVGTSLVDMRNAADPRVPLEVALVRLTRRGSDSVDGLLARIEALEAAVARGGTAVAKGADTRSDGDAASGRPMGSGPVTAQQRPTAPGRPGAAEVVADEDRPQDSAPRTGQHSGPARARAELERQKAARNGDGGRVAGTGGSGRASDSDVGGIPVPPATAPEGPPRPPTAQAPDSSQRDIPPSDTPPIDGPPLDAPAAVEAPVAGDGAGSAGAALTVESLNGALTNHVLVAMKGVAKAIYSQGSFVAAEGSTGVFLVENAPTRERAEKSRAQVEDMLTKHLGVPVTVRITDNPSDGAAVIGPPPGGPGSRTQRAAPTVPGSTEHDGSTGARSPTNDQRGPASRRPPRTPDPLADNSARGLEPSQSHGGPRDRTNPAPSDDDQETFDEMSIDVDDLIDATDVAQTGLDRLLEAFPGATVVTSDQTNNNPAK